MGPLDAVPDRMVGHHGYLFVVKADLGTDAAR
jgi:hypothetical protein